MDDYEDGDSSDQPRQLKKGNILPLWGNAKSMNMNPLILTNIQSSHYFKVNLYELKTYHEVIDEIYYKVSHLEPWEKGSRKTAGQTGMCGGVRGVGAGGIVSTAYCLLYKLFTLRLTRKQLNGLINHADSPYIRALGFMYIRYTQPPGDLYDWYDEFLEDAEEVDVKAGGGQVMAMGDVLKAFLTKLEWFSTLFPRIPVPIQQSIESKMNERFPPVPQVQRQGRDVRYAAEPVQDKFARNGNRNNDKWNDRGNERWNDRGSGSTNRERSPVQIDRHRQADRERERDGNRQGDRERERDGNRESNRRDRDRLDSHRDRHSHRDRERDHRHRDDRNRSHHHHR